MPHVLTRVAPWGVLGGPGGILWGAIRVWLTQGAGRGDERRNEHIQRRYERIGWAICIFDHICFIFDPHLDHIE